MVEIKRSERGRPTKYLPCYDRQVAKLCLLGAIDTDLADFFEVSVSTLALWKIAHPRFSSAIKASKLQADTGVAASLYKRGIGYKITEKKIERSGTGDKEEVLKTIIITRHLAPDVAACIFWLKNRQPELWRERRDQVLSAAENVEFNMHFSDALD